MKAATTQKLVRKANPAGTVEHGIFDMICKSVHPLAESNPDVPQVLERLYFEADQWIKDLQTVVNSQIGAIKVVERIGVDEDFPRRKVVRAFIVHPDAATDPDHDTELTAVAGILELVGGVIDSKRIGQMDHESLAAAIYSAKERVQAILLEA